MLRVPARVFPIGSGRTTPFHANAFPRGA